MSPTKRTVKKRPSAKDTGRIARPPAAPARGKEGEGRPEAQGRPVREEGARDGGHRAAKRRRWPKVVAAVLAFAVVACGAAFSWDRWLRYDDAADFQGEWLVASTDATAAVQIDAGQIKLTDDVAYAYTLDPGAKTLTFTFGDLSGSGRYRFSADRTQVAVMEGGGYSWLSTLSDDMAWGVWSLVCAVQGQPAPSPAEGAQATILVRSGAAAAEGDEVADGTGAAAGAADGTGAAAAAGDAAVGGAGTVDAQNAADTAAAAEAQGTADAGA